ncbi:hypothetical protein PAXINDRAFT_15199 [Paxillus involutus ATCC 200175]|uniref:Zn(2)-C6 fungal-type domain-containing protein n=1 Tax=Paxillus involutus ATCC 200175 TaxID=664439 RepID=A0A0C9TWF0_PAXIN|nr:hypothetical protein PAXINDRAFT_15199 [Paxillus involutus ATCC 200175]
MSSSSDEINPAELQIREAEEKRARRDAEREKKWVAAEACRKAEEEAVEAARKKAEEERKKSRSMEADKKKKTPGLSVARSQENEAGASQAGSVRSAGWRPGLENPCTNCTQLEIKCNEPLTKKSRTCFQCRTSHIVCREPRMQPKKKRQTINLTSPQDGKERKHRRQGSPNYREKGSEDGIRGDEAEEEREDVIGAIMEAIVAFTEQYEVEVAAVTGFRRELIYELGGIRITTQALARAYLQDRAARQEGSGVVSGSGSRIRAKKVGEGSGLKKVDLKGKGKKKPDLKEMKPDLKGKGKGRAVEEDEDMDISDGKGDGEDDKDADGTLK